MSERRPLIVVFDPQCILCSGWVSFLQRRSRDAAYRFAARNRYRFFEGGRAAISRAPKMRTDSSTEAYTSAATYAVFTVVKNSMA